MSGRRGISRRRVAAGFTMVELLITVTILGIVSAGICTSLVMAVQEGPTVQHRSNFAGQASFLISSISDDVANAQSSWVAQDPSSATTCTSNGVVDMRHIPLNDGTTAYYEADIGTNPTSTVQGVSIYEVDVKRTLTSGANHTTSTLLTAYCSSGASLGAGATYSDPTYTLDLSLQAAEGADTRKIALTASRRTKLAANFSVSGSIFNDANDDGALSGGEVGVSGVSVKVYDSTQATLVSTLTTDGSGNFAGSLPPGSYVVCQGLQTNWLGTFPASTSGVTSCNSGGYGYVVTPALTSSITFGTYDQYWGNPSPATCSNQPVPSALDTTTGNWPGNLGPDYWVYTNHGMSVQSAIDKAAQADSPTTGDINGDGVIIIQVVTHDDGSPNGNIAQKVAISASYSKKFALLGCGSTLVSGGASPAIWVKSTAGATTTTVNADSGGSANIYIGNIHGGNSATGVEIDGDGRYLRTVHATSNTGAGFLVTGNSNTIYSGYAGNGIGTGNGANGVTITGNSNKVTGSFNAFNNTGYGISVTGNSNTLNGVDLGDSGKANTLDGARVVGNSNTLNQVTAYANSQNGIYVQGDSNTLTSITAGAHNKGNGQDGVHVVGNSNTITSNKADENGGDGFDISGGTTTANSLKSNSSAGSYENVGAEFQLKDKITNNSGGNKADGTTVPKSSAPTKCNSAGTQFPATNTTGNYASAQLCE